VSSFERYSLVTINRRWWEYLAPKIMHRRLREVEALLQTWCRSDYGAHWLAMARQERGVIRVKPGQIIPDVHLIALGEQRIFVAPQETARVGHRMVGASDYASGQPLEAGELALCPVIRLEVVQDAAFLAAAARMQTSGRILGVKEPSVLFSSPAHYLLTPKIWPNKAYVLYQHIFGEGNSYPIDGYFYVGVTTRSWQTRWAEHCRAIETGSPLLFHRKLREELSAGRVTYVHHKVMGITDDLEALYAAEEGLVEGHWLDDRRLNMIPGGKSGLKYLRDNGMLAERAVPLPDERDRIVAAWLLDHPRKGLPAPWVAEKWKDDVWAMAQICGRDDRLSVEQVRAIRELATVHSAEVIAERIGARNSDQVQRVIDSKTYTRVV
jgi:hypothetical protein